MASLPYVLLRKGKPRMDYAAGDAARGFYDRLRHNNAAGAQGAVLYGPAGEAWYVGPGRFAQWRRDDERRKREAADAAGIDAA